MEITLMVAKNMRSLMLSVVGMFVAAGLFVNVAVAQNYSSGNYGFAIYAGGPDVTAPVLSNGAPSGTLAAGTTGTTLSVTTNESATCRYGTTANTLYASIGNTFATTGGTSHSNSLSGLSNGTTYTYYVRCTDGTNANTSDFAITFSVASPSTSGGGGGGSGGSSSSSGSTGYVPSISPPIATSTTPVLPIQGCFPGHLFSTVTGQACPKGGEKVFGYVFTRDISFGMSGDDVRALQDILISKGFLAQDKNTGYFYTLTHNALIAYQKAKGITPASGRFGPLTRASLQGSAAPSAITPTAQLKITKTLSFGMQDSEVTILQQILQTIPGIYPQGLASGYFGEYTKQAVQRFQLKYDIADEGETGYGIVGPVTRKVLNSL